VTILKSPRHTGYASCRSTPCPRDWSPRCALILRSLSNLMFFSDTWNRCKFESNCWVKTWSAIWVSHFSQREGAVTIHTVLQLRFCQWLCRGDNVFYQKYSVHTEGNCRCDQLQEQVTVTCCLDVPNNLRKKWWPSFLHWQTLTVGVDSLETLCCNSTCSVEASSFYLSRLDKMS